LTDSAANRERERQSARFVVEESISCTLAHVLASNDSRDVGRRDPRASREPERPKRA